MNPANQATILVIDDEAPVRQSLVDYLEDLGHDIFAAENGRTGVELFERERIDLVLVDLRMPEMDGLEVLAHITRTSPNTPLIVVSGTGVIADAVEALHQGAWDYLLKPIEDFSVLTHAVENALEKARLRQENQRYQQHLEQMVADRTKELKQANDHLEHINTRLRRIVDTTRTLSYCDEVDKFSCMLLNEFGQHMLATGGSLYFKEADGLHLVHTLDQSAVPRFIPFPLQENAAIAQVMAQNRPLLIKDVASVADLANSDPKGDDRGSALIFPLPDESGEVTALLTLHNRKPPPFVEQDREIGSILASYSSEALRAVRATENLRENEQQFRSILDTIQAGIIIIDAETNRVVYANPTAAEMVGAPAEDIIQGRYGDILCPEDEEPNGIDHFREIRSSERMLKTIDGSSVPILRTVSRMVYRGKDCLLESFFDLSAQKQVEVEKNQLETQLRQAQKMEALGTLAGGIAHDFNNILSAIIGYTELCFLECQEPSNPLYQKLNSILHAGKRASELVTQILMFSRMKEQILSPIDIAPIIKEALKLLQASLPANIELKNNISTQQQVLADPTQIHQIVMNLCTNAYHAMEESGGTLTVSLSSITLDQEGTNSQLELPPGKYVQLTVEDTGIGISPSVLSNIFDPYFSTKDKGTGLGLSVVHGIVKGHAGAMSVESTVGEGTAMRVILPESKDTRDTQHRQQPALPRGTEKVLLVDDEKDLIDIGCQMLSLLGYKPTGVVGSVEALERFKQSPQEFDLVITDLNMPGMTGEQLAREIVSLRADMPVILCTGFSDRLNRNRTDAAGIRQIVMKPIAMNILAETVREVLDERQSGE